MGDDAEKADAEKTMVLEKRMEVLEEQIKRIMNEKEGENKEIRRAELERKMLDKKIETLENRIVTITKILKQDDKRIKDLIEENKKLRINISVMMTGREKEKERG